VRWGCSAKARQIRLIALWVMPVRLAMERVLQWVAPTGVLSRVKVTTRSTSVSVILRGAPGRGSSRSPSRRRSQNRARHLPTICLVTPISCPTTVLVLPSAHARIDRDGNLLDSMLSAQRDRAAARVFLRRLLAIAPQKPLRVTTDKHPAYPKAIRWIVGRNVLHRQSQYLNNRIEQDHRALKQRYYPMLGFGRLASAERFCAAFEELRQYLRVKPGRGVTLAERRLVFVNRWQTLMAELAA
jgi:DDE domain